MNHFCRLLLGVLLASLALGCQQTNSPDANADTDNLSAMTTLPAIDDLWDFQDPEASEKAFRELLEQASDNEPYYREVQTQIARTHSLRGQFDEAHEILDEVSEALPSVGHLVEVRYLLERGRTWNSSGEKERAKAVFLQAYNLAKEDALDFYEIDAAHMLGIVEQPEQALEWNLVALAKTEATDDQKAKKWIGPLANNIGWTYHDQGDFENALKFFRKGLEFRETTGAEPGLRIAKWTVARGLRSLGKVKEALAMQHAIIDEYYSEVDPAAADLDPTSIDGYVVEEIGECLWALGKEEEAKPYLANAYKILSQDDWMVKNEKDRLDSLKSRGE